MRAVIYLSVLTICNTIKPPESPIDHGAAWVIVMLFIVFLLLDIREINMKGNKHA